MNELEYSDFLKGETDLEREAGLILEHHGIKGQRWGVRRTPEQLGHKKRGAFTGVISSIRKKQAAAKKKAAKKKAAKQKQDAKKQEESDEKIREKLLTSTDPAFIYKYRTLLDSKELQDRIDRINKEQKIKDLIPDPNAKRKKTMKSGEEFLKSAASMADSVGKIYDTYNKISGTGKKDSGGGGGGKKQQNQKKDDSDKTKKEKKQEKKDAATNAKAAKEFLSDPGVKALLALGMVTPADRKDLSKRAQEENEKRKKSWGSNS